MTRILEQLWDGSIHPYERAVQSGSEYARLQQESQVKLDQFMELLSPEAQDAYRAYCKVSNRMSGISDMDLFITGYRLGAQLLLAAIGEYDTQLPQIR